MRAFGMPQALIDEAEKIERAEIVCEVWPENWPSVRLFLDLSTQWEVSFNGPVGLRYDSALAVMRVRGIKSKLRAEFLDDLRIMEQTALETIRKQRGQNGS